MSRQIDLEGRAAGWRALAWAGVGATAVTLLLVLSVGLVWLVGRTPSNAPALGAPAPSTPTPRSLAFLNETPTPAPLPSPTPAPPATATIAVATETAATTATPSPALLAMVGEERAVRAAPKAVFSAPGDAELASLASGSWIATADTVRNEGATAVAEPWLMLATVPAGAFAVEAEIRVNGLLDSVCDQSFGLAGGAPDTGQVYGAGVLFPCDSEATRARLTDVAVWQDGYNADPLLAEDAFDPGDDWRTYRFEVRGDRLRLIVDGAGVVSGSASTAIDPSVSTAEVGIWAQGVDLEFRGVAVYALPAG